MGARTISFEPLPVTFQQLEKNIRINHLEQLAKIYNTGVGSERTRIVLLSMRRKHFTMFDLSLEVLRVVEQAAIASARTMGMGDADGADHAAVESMRATLDTIGIEGIGRKLHALLSGNLRQGDAERKRLPSVSQFDFNLPKVAVIAIVDWVVGNQVLRAKLFGNLSE